jgi:hypothetical protein
MTQRPNLTSRWGLVPLFRSLAGWSRLRLALGHLVCTAIAATLYDLGISRSLPSLQVIGATIGVVAASLLFTVVTWYRTDEVPGSAFLLAATVSLSYAIGFSIAVFFLSRAAGLGMLLAAGTFFSVPVRILILSLIFSVLVSVGRRLRWFFAPETVGEAPRDL